MVIMVIENASASLRGELTRWLIEPKPGVFVGSISALIREKLWNRISKRDSNGALMVYSANNEQGYKMEMIGEPTRSIVDLDGVQLIKTLIK